MTQEQIIAYWNGYIDGKNNTLDKYAKIKKQKIKAEKDFGSEYDCGYQAGYTVAKKECVTDNNKTSVDDDEEIRKEIIEYFKHYSGSDNISIRFPKWLAYLEKQKAKERLDRMAPIYNDKESFESALEKAWKYYNESSSRTVDSFEDDYIECVFSKGFREGFLYKEKQKDASKAIEAIEKIDKYIDEHVVNAHDMKDSDPDKKYYSGWDDALAKMSGILQDVYSDEKQKEQKPTELEQLAKLREMTHEIRDAYERGIEVGRVESQQEWSDEDKRMLNAASSVLKSVGHDTLANYLLKLKHLQPVKQEWSEDYKEEDIQTRFAFYTYKDDPSVLYLSNVFVEETSRNNGFGTKILRAAEKVAETIGAITIRLKVKQDSPVNVWYRKNGYVYVTFEDGYDWLEKSLEYMKPVKQDWSEIDNIMLENIILCLKEYCLTDEINWIKSFPKRFNLQPKHGWRRYIWTVNLRFDYDGLIRYEDNGSYEIVTAGNKPKRQVNGEYILLKDIQLTDWKPNKEQIEALNEAVGNFRMEDTASCEKTADILESLYNDLQKLL